MYKIAISSDHSGFILKEKIVVLLRQMGHRVVDYGTDCQTKSVDYPDYAKLVCESLAEEICAFGILLCGSGIGMSIAANRFSHIRAALCRTVQEAILARSHTNANILVLAAKFISFDEAHKVISNFLVTGFEGGRHANRIAKIR